MLILKGEGERKKKSEKFKEKTKEKHHFILIRYKSNHNSSNIQSKLHNIENHYILEVVQHRNNFEIQNNFNLKDIML